MTWPSPPTASNTSPILASRCSVGEAERVVDDDRHAVLLGDQRRAGQPGDDAQLFLGSARTATRTARCVPPACGCRCAGRCRRRPRSRRRTRCGPTAPPRRGTGRRSAAAWRRGAAHHRPQQLRGPGAALHAPELGLGVLTFGLGGVQPALAALRAVHLQLGGDLAQRLCGVVVPSPNGCGVPLRVRQRGGDRVGMVAGQLVADPGHQRLSPGRHLRVGLGLDRQLVVADGSAVRSEALPPRRPAPPARPAASPLARAARTPRSASSLAASSATFRCVSQSRTACWCAAVAASRSARNTAGSCGPAVAGSPRLPPPEAGIEPSAAGRRACSADNRDRSSSTPPSAVSTSRMLRNRSPASSRLAAPLVERAGGRDVGGTGLPQRGRQRRLGGVERCLSGRRPARPASPAPRAHREHRPRWTADRRLTMCRRRAG